MWKDNAEHNDTDHPSFTTLVLQLPCPALIHMADEPTLKRNGRLLFFFF